MAPLRLTDLLLASLLSLAPFAYVLRYGDELYLGVWYYIAAPLVVITYASYLTPRSFFVLGAACGLLFSYLPYWSYQHTSTRPDGLLGLVHLFSLPALLVGLLAAKQVLGRWGSGSTFVALLFGAGGAMVGASLGELALCAARIVCGPISITVLLPR